MRITLLQAAVLAMLGLMPGGMVVAKPPAPAVAAPRHADARVEGAWVRAAPPGVDMLAGYMVIHNDGTTPLQLASASSDAFAMVELHRTTTAGGMSSMHPAGMQTIPAGGELRIAPGGLHWMLMSPRRALKIGDGVNFTLHFTGAGAVTVHAIVAAQTPTGK